MAEQVAKVTIDNKPKEEPVATRRPKEQAKMTDAEINEGLSKYSLLITMQSFWKICKVPLIVSLKEE